MRKFTKRSTKKSTDRINDAVFDALLAASVAEREQPDPRDDFDGGRPGARVRPATGDVLTWLYRWSSLLRQPGTPGQLPLLGAA